MSLSNNIILNSISNILVIDHQYGFLSTLILYISFNIIEYAYLHYVKTAHTLKIIDKYFSLVDGKLLNFIDTISQTLQTIYLSYVFISLINLVSVNYSNIYLDLCSILIFLVIFISGIFNYPVGWFMPISYLIGVFLFNNFVSVNTFSPLNLSSFNLTLSALIGFHLRLSHEFNPTPLKLDRGKTEDVVNISNYTVFTSCINFMAYIIYLIINSTSKKYTVLNLIIEIIGVSQILSLKLNPNNLSWDNKSERISILFRGSVFMVILFGLCCILYSNNISSYILSYISKTKYIKLIFISQYLNIPFVFFLLSFKTYNLVANKNYSEWNQIFILILSICMLFYMILEDILNLIYK